MGRYVWVQDVRAVEAPMAGGEGGDIGGCLLGYGTGPGALGGVDGTHEAGGADEHVSENVLFVGPQGNGGHLAVVEDPHLSHDSRLARLLRPQQENVHRVAVVVFGASHLVLHRVFHPADATAHATANDVAVAITAKHVE